tara:strand:+ start:158 stop:889 length:732 start_codon:yes stop_codon:yes gene_type:complete
MDFMPDVAPKHIQVMVQKYLGAISDDHWVTLYRKRRETLSKDEFGIEDEASVEKWEGIMHHYLDNLIIPKMTDKEKMDCDDYISSVLIKSATPYLASTQDAVRWIFRFFMNATLDVNKKDLEAQLNGSRPDDGIAYEHYCVSKFQEAGWNSNITQASSDQGCDLIAEKGGVKLIVQCKRYSNPVGNKAVQEVVGAIKHYGGTHGAVVTNSSFTPSAKTLARSNSIHLLHDSKISSLYHIIAQE